MSGIVKEPCPRCGGRQESQRWFHNVCCTCGHGSPNSSCGSSHDAAKAAELTALRARCAEAEGERDELRVALEFYADDRKYEAPEGARPAIVAFDSGAHARTVLLRTGKARSALAPVKP